MRRRDFLGALTAASAGASLGGTAAARRPGRRRSLRATRTATSQIPQVAMDSAASLLDSNYGTLTDGSVVALWLEDTATNTDADGNGDAVSYPENVAIPVVATDSNVVGFGGMVANDGRNWQYGNEEFLLNVWDDALGGSGTVLWDEGHGQYYTLSTFSEFETYAENNGYTVTATSSLSSDLSGADAAVVTSPGSTFSGSELQDLGDFVASGGWLFLHDQSDYGNYDATAALNDVAAQLGLAFRFNDDQVVDEVQNVDANYQPVTTEFNTAFPYFADRDGLGLDPDATYTGTVTAVTDGDTVDVEFPDGTVESVRILGLDTPETSANSQYERIQEWEGIESNTYLENWADQATTFAQNELSGETVDVSFDAEEPARDVFGRVLGYVHYDATGDGTRDAFYNRRLVEQGYARVYSSGLARHEEFWDAEATARANSRRVWQQSDPDASTEIRNRQVGDLFLPWAASVRTSGGAIADSRVPVYAESSASQDLDGGISYAQIPLVGVDESNNVAIVGSPLVDEGYESGEGYAVDTSTYENFVFLTNLLDHLSDLGSGDVLIDGGHGQFNASYGLSCEDAAYYQRFLEGQDVAFEGVNSLTEANLSRGRAIVITAGPESFTGSEIDALNAFVADGGAVVLLGAGKLKSEARTYLNDLASGLGTDLRLNADQVLDSTNNVNSDAEVPATTNFDASFPLFSAYSQDPSVVVSTDSAANVDDTSATLHGSLTDLGGASSADCYFEYREAGTSSWTATSAQTLSATGSFTASVSGLSAGADYEYRAVSDASDGDGDLGTIVSFTTGAAVAVTTGSTSGVGDNAATLAGSLDDLGGASSADCYFEYRETGTSTWATTNAQTLSATGSFSETVSGLSAGTDYEFRAVADASDGDSATGSTATFATTGGASVSTGSASSVDASSATLGGSLDGLGGASSADCYFEYRQTGAGSWTATATQTLSATGSFSEDVTGLSAGTDYEFRAVADASDGDSATGATASFTTGSGGTGELAIGTIDASNEWVDLSNVGSASLDLTGWAVEDEAGHHFDFPGGFTLAAGDTVRLHSGDGTDTSTDLYWGNDYVWNDGGDTCYVYDDAGTLVAEKTYPEGELSIATIHHDASGNDANNLNDEYVDFENVGAGDLDLSGWSVEDEAGKHYDFPSGFTLAAGDTVRLHSGTGTGTATDLYWGKTNAGVWNNGGDTCYVFDDSGSQVLSQSYSGSGGGSMEIAGLDASNEWVDLSNVGSGSVDLTGWAVEDSAGHHYDFPSGFTLAAGDTVRLHSGDGTDTSTDLYWGNDYIWNNGGDTCTLLDDSGSTVDTYSY